MFAGGARIIHGLQGNDKGAVRPANEPPYDAWFIDNDGLYLDADVYGHVGDIAIFNPCDKRTIAEPEPLPFPEEYGEPGEPSVPPYPEDTPPDLSTPGIYIDKECFPGIIGGEIHCVITLTNVGETLSDPIDLYDAATAFGGGGVTITGVTPDGPIGSARRRRPPICGAACRPTRSIPARRARSTCSSIPARYSPAAASASSTAPSSKRLGTTSPAMKAAPTSR